MISNFLRIIDEENYLETHFSFFASFHDFYAMELSHTKSRSLLQEICPAKKKIDGDIILKIAENVMVFFCACLKLLFYYIVLLEIIPLKYM